MSSDANVRSIAWASTLPLGESTFGATSFEVVGDTPVEENRRPTTDYQIVSPTYFSTLELPMVAGRAFTDADTADGTPVCIVNEAFVRRHLQGRSVIGEKDCGSRAVRPDPGSTDRGRRTSGEGAT